MEDMLATLHREGLRMMDERLGVTIKVITSWDELPEFRHVDGVVMVVKPDYVCRVLADTEDVVK